MEQITDTQLIIQNLQARQTPDLRDLSDVVVWEPYNVLDLAHVSWIRHVPYSTAPQQPIKNCRCAPRWHRP